MDARVIVDKQDLDVETLHKYADVLRIGRLLVNGREITWETRASNSMQLQNFCSAFTNALERVPELSNLESALVYQAAHLTCKALSINYAMSEVLQLVGQRISEKRSGCMCSIRTCGDTGKSLVDYVVEILPDNVMRTRVSWRGKGNIISCNMKTAKRKVRGTLFHMETEFPMAVERSFIPTYSLQMDLAPSRRSRLASAMTGAFKGPGAVKAPRKQLAMERVRPSTPLCFDSCGRSRSTTAESVSTPSSGDNISESSDSEMECTALIPTPRVQNTRHVKKRASVMKAQWMLPYVCK